MGVQIIHDNSHYLDLRVSLIHQPTHLVGEVLAGPSLGDGHVPPTPQRFTGQEQVPGSLPPVLVVLAPRRPGFAERGGRGSLSSWVEVSSKQTTGRRG